MAAGRHAAAERFSRGAGGLAGATGEPFAVWLEDWRADSLNADGSAVRLVARDAASGLSLDLELRATKPLVAHGDRGLSPKSDEPGNASHYVGYTRMSARGRIGTADIAGGSAAVREVEVTGEAWFDHEWSTSALGAGAVGWDWFSLQLDDGRELMHFQIRREDGEIEPVSGGTLVEPDGRTRRLSRDDVRIEVLAPLDEPRHRRDLPLPLAAGRPLRGPRPRRRALARGPGDADVVRLLGRSRPRRRGSRPSGKGYVELTGYARSMQGVF